MKYVWQAHHNDLHTHSHTLHSTERTKNHSVTTQSEIGTKFEIHFEIHIQLETFVYIIIIIEREAERGRKSQSTEPRVQLNRTDPIRYDPYSVVCDINLAINQMATRLSRQLGATRNKKKADMGQPTGG